MFYFTATSNATLVESLRDLMANSETGRLFDGLQHDHAHLSAFNYLSDYVHMVYSPSDKSEHEVFKSYSVVVHHESNEWSYPFPSQLFLHQLFYNNWVVLLALTDLLAIKTAPNKLIRVKFTQSATRFDVGLTVETSPLFISSPFKFDPYQLILYQVFFRFPTDAMP